MRRLGEDSFLSLGGKATARLPYAGKSLKFAESKSNKDPIVPKSLSSRPDGLFDGNPFGKKIRKG